MDNVRGSDLPGARIGDSPVAWTSTGQHRAAAIVDVDQEDPHTVGMAFVSLRSRLSEIGEPSPGASVRIPGDFHVTPGPSLRAMMKAMRSPKPSQWTKPDEGQFYNKNWTEECQGVTHDSTHWYLSSNHDGKQRVYKFSLANDVVSHVKLAGNGSGHLGDIDYHNGRIYCAMEQPIKIVVIDTPPFTGWWTAELVGANGGAPPQDANPWCAIHPWNGLLYSSNFGGGSPGEDTLRAYRFEPNPNRFVHEPSADIVLEEGVRRIQGAVFSKNGHVLIASDQTDDIRCYSTLNGAYRGRAKIQKDGSWNVAEEVEGITIWEGIAYDGVDTHVHVILLDNDGLSKDDVYFKHYRVPASQHL